MLVHTMGELDTLVIVGIDKEGENYLASSDKDTHTTMWLVVWAQHYLMSEDL